MKRLFLLCFLFVLLVPRPLWAGSSAWQKTEGVAVRLVAAHDVLGPELQEMMGLDVALEEGWHTYWRNPGDAGTPPSIVTDGSVNIRNLEILYPAPRRYSLMGIDTIGYHGSVLFPLVVTRQNSAQGVTLKASVDLLVCATLCVPRHFDFALTLPAGAGVHGAEKPLIDAALALVPRTENTPDLSAVEVTRSASSVSVVLKSESGFKDPDLFVESDGNLVFGKPKAFLPEASDKTSPPAGEEVETWTYDSKSLVSTGGGSQSIPTHNPPPSFSKDLLTQAQEKLSSPARGEVKNEPHILTLTAELLSSLPAGQTLLTLPLTLTIVNGDTAMEVRTSTSHKATPLSPDVLPLWSVILLALLGGFIMNLMPCVLPVLSLKVLSVMKNGGKEHHHVRRTFLASASGIVFSFLLLALATISLKLSGQALGWGVQFQQPVFLVFMIVLLTLFAANLWDFFEVTLPRFLLDRIDAHHHPKLAGDFATGMLATLLATPCSAPFLGTAIGFALASGTSEILAVFLALGLGMALPYLAIALWPRLTRAMPKPGAWMETLKHILGFGMAGTAGWLLWVIAAQVGRTLTALIAAAMLVVLSALYLRHKGRLRRTALLLLGAAVAGAFFIALSASVPASLAKDSGVWERFEESKIADAAAQGKIVFVDVTADWCITCKFNKRFILSQSAIAARLMDKNHVLALQADWTNPDPVISEYLRRHGVFGVPFNIVYGPSAPQGIALPELLTPSAVLDALERAGVTR